MAKKTFIINAAQVRIRREPSLKGAMVRWLPKDTRVEVEESSRREADGYVWWQHAEGWSAEKDVASKELLMVEAPATEAAKPAAPDAAAKPVTPTPSEPAPAAPAPDSAKTTAEGKARTEWQVGGVQVRVREQAGIGGRFIRWIAPGTRLTVDPNSRMEKDGYIWWRHNEGWTAEATSDRAEVFLVEPGTDISPAAVSAVPVTAEGLPDVTKLPQLGALFSRLPVDLAMTKWWQYFGNNVFAFNLIRDGKNWYSYCQGLHGGLDFGNSSDKGVPIYAGLNGTFSRVDTKYYKPNGIFVKVGDYLVIYGHLENPRSFAPNAPITPDTVLGEIQLGGQAHLHLEVRYKDRWIINPLVLFPQAFQDQILAKFPPGPKYFYQENGWNRWIAPYDQPVLTLSGSIIGPHGK
jgi:murein DD-endopeptidase MepM/ murein hydrolase activator NlpD